MQHSNVSYPVIHVFWQDGYSTNIRRKDGGTLVEAGIAYVNEIIKSLPQNGIANQEVNHANPVSGIATGVAAILGSVPNRGER